jgi:hypothetical protein
MAETEEGIVAGIFPSLAERRPERQTAKHRQRRADERGFCKNFSDDGRAFHNQPANQNRALVPGWSHPAATLEQAQWGKKPFFGLLILFTRMPFDGKNATGSKLREVKTPKGKEKYDPSDF